MLFLQFIFWYLIKLFAPKSILLKTPLQKTFQEQWLFITNFKLILLFSSVSNYCHVFLAFLLLLSPLCKPQCMLNYCLSFYAWCVKKCWKYLFIFFYVLCFAFHFSFRYDFRYAWDFLWSANWSKTLESSIDTFSVVITWHRLLRLQVSSAI